MTNEEELKIQDALMLTGYKSDRAGGRLNFDPGRRIEMKRFCAFHDRLYLVVYSPANNGLFRFRESHASTAIHCYHEGLGDLPKYRVEPIDRSLIDPYSRPEECAFCKTVARVLPGRHSPSNFIQCGHCQKLVCLGRTLRNHFYCRTSCGNHGEVVDEEIEMYGSITNSDSRGRCPAGTGAKAIKSPELLNIGGGLWIALRK